MVVPPPCELRKTSATESVPSSWVGGGVETEVCLAAEPRSGAEAWSRNVGLGAIVAACLTGWGMVWILADRVSATYDEVAYQDQAARWWRTGEDETISRMGSPVTFWKLQQTVPLAIFDLVGLDCWIDQPAQHRAESLPWLRRASGVFLALTAALTGVWAWRIAGPIAGGFAAWMTVLSPNLLAHGGLITMESPLTAASAVVFWTAWEALRARNQGRAAAARRWWLATGLSVGLAFSLKFTALLYPWLVAGCGWVVELRRGEVAAAAWRALARGLGLMMSLVLVNLLLTGGATLVPSRHQGAHPVLERLPEPARRGVGWLIERPWPRDWAALAIQLQHQRGGGPSYLLGEVRDRGWREYYLLALVVKMPLAVWGLLAARAWWSWVEWRESTQGRTQADLFAPLVVMGFLAIASLGSSRNYGMRYVLPVAPAAIVWVAGLLRASRPLGGGRLGRAAGLAGLTALASATASCLPYPLTFFNTLAGGVSGGAWWLADSNLDWGQGARPLAECQAQRPELTDLTLFAFGDADPAEFGVVGVIHLIDAHGFKRIDGRLVDRGPQAGASRQCLPRPEFSATRYVAVSLSLSHGPWGPPGWFAVVRQVQPIAVTPDGSIWIYETQAVRQAAQSQTNSN